MNLAYLQECLPGETAYHLLSRTTERDGASYAFIGFSLCGGALSLSVLSHDPAQHLERLAHQEKVRAFHARPDTQRTRRMRMELDSCRLPDHFLQGVQEIRLGEQVLPVDGMRYDAVRNDDWNELIQLSDWLRQGFVPPAALSAVPLEELTYYQIRFRGRFETIPPINAADALVLHHGPNALRVPAQMRFTVPVEEQTALAGSFTEEQTGEIHRFCIRRVQLEDVSGSFDMEEHPDQRRRMGEAAYQTWRQQTRAALEEICPPGRRIPVVAYTCDDGFSLEFAATSYLDEVPCPPRSNGSHATVLFSTEQSEWNGRPCLQHTLQGAVAADTKILDLELTHYQKKLPPFDWSIP